MYYLKVMKINEDKLGVDNVGTIISYINIGNAYNKMD